MRTERKAEAYKEIRESDLPKDSGNLSEAIKAVYRQYGDDLPAFFRNAYKKAEERHRKSVDSKPEAVTP